MLPAVELQKIYWGDAPGAFIAAHMLYSIATHGGHVLASTDGNTVTGIVIGLLGMNTDHPLPHRLHIYSKRMIVSPDYRNQGLGRHLKFAQRAVALQQGIKRVVWTFDPLLAPNAHLNLRKLGCISRQYHHNYYGTNNTGGLSPDGTSDRLYLEWPIEDDAIQRRAEGTFTGPTLDDLLADGTTVLNPSDHHTSPYPIPGEYQPNHNGPALIEIPRQFQSIQQHHPDLARLWRRHIRATLAEKIRSGFQVVDFVSGDYHGANRSFYVLTQQN